VAALYTDEDASHAMAARLTALGHLVMTTRQQGHEGNADAAQLLHAASLGALLITHNRRDFELLQEAWVIWNEGWGTVRDHAGMLVIPPVWPQDVAAHMLNTLLGSNAQLAGELHAFDLNRVRWMRYDVALRQYMLIGQDAEDGT
jgi:hypothetical protein